MVFEGVGELVRFDDNLLSCMHRYIQLDPSTSESGGVVLGRKGLCDGSLVVTHITEPMAGDIRTHCQFNRLDIGHVKLYELLLRESSNYVCGGGEMAYSPATSAISVDQGLY